MSNHGDACDASLHPSLVGTPTKNNKTNREGQTQRSAPTFEIKKAFFLKKAFLNILRLSLTEY
jgi:hypothetical protein